MKHTLYDWRDYLIDGTETDWREACAECRDCDPEELSDWDVINFASDTAMMDWEDLGINLRIPVTTGVFCAANLGLWNGRRTGWKILDAAKISDCLSVTSRDGEYYTIGINDDDALEIVEIHHDGTNYLTFYTFTCENEELEDRLYEGADVGDLLADGTLKPLSGEIKRVFGWED